MSEDEEVVFEVNNDCYGALFFILVVYIVFPCVTLYAQLRLRRLGFLYQVPPILIFMTTCSLI